MQIASCSYLTFAMTGAMSLSLYSLLHRTADTEATRSDRSDGRGL